MTLKEITSYSYDKNGNRYRSVSSLERDEYNGNRLILIDKKKWSGGLLRKYFQYNFISFNYLLTGEIFYYKSEYDDNGQMRYLGDAAGQYYMSYNHKNERTVRSLNTSGDWYANAIQFVYDESSNLLGEYAPDGTPIVEYVWIDSRPVAAIYGTGDSTKIYAIVTDHNNTLRMLVNNATNEIVWNWESTAFGVGQPTGNVTFNLRFPGQYYDQHTGLHYNLNRYYNPELGRYMEPDPIGLEGGSNPYAYAGNNPISNVDPSGLDFSSSLYTLAYNSTYAINDGLTFGLWTNFNNWYYGGTGFDPTCTGAYIGNFATMAFTGPSSIAKNGVGIVAGEIRTLSPFSSKMAANLKDHLRQTEKYGQGGIKELEDGKIRYYGESIAPRKSVEMISWRTVREWNPATGNKRT